MALVRRRGISLGDIVRHPVTRYVARSARQYVQRSVGDYFARKRHAYRPAEGHIAKKRIVAPEENQLIGPAMPRVGRGVTAQHDSSMQYRRRRMPRRKRRRWTKFIKKVAAATDNKLPLRSVVLNTQYTFEQEGLARQNYTLVPLYSAKSTFVVPDPPQNAQFSDMNRIVTTEFTNFESVRHLRFESAVLDLTIHDTQTPGSSPTELDLYYIMFRKDVYMTDFGQLVNNSATYLPSVNEGISAPKLTLQSTGATPFSLPNLCAHFQIIKKEKVITTAGSITTRQWRIPKNKYLNTANLRHISASGGNQNMFAMRGWTCGILLIAKGTPVPETPNRDFSYEINSTRSYNYKIIEYSGDAATYQPPNNTSS